MMECESQRLEPPPPRSRCIWVEKAAHKMSIVAPTLSTAANTQPTNLIDIPSPNPETSTAKDIIHNHEKREDNPMEKGGPYDKDTSGIFHSSNTYINPNMELTPLIEEQEKHLEEYHTQNKDRNDTSGSEGASQEANDQPSQIEETYLSTRSRKGGKPMVDADGFITPNPRKTRKCRDYSQVERTIVTRSLDPSKKENYVPPLPPTMVEAPLQPITIEHSSASSNSSDSDDSESDPENDHAY